MGTQIISNGSKFLGEEPDSIETLLGVLATHPLEDRFKGMLIRRDGDGAVNFFGNFTDLSHVFQIISDDPAVVAPLTRAIRNNRRRFAK